MSRPTLATIGTGLATWDADVDNNFSLLTESPYPPAQYDNVGLLPTASSYDDCFALVGTTNTRLYHSVSSAWVMYDREAAYVAPSVATTVPQLVVDLNLFLTSLITAEIMAAS